MRKISGSRHSHWNTTQKRTLDIITQTINIKTREKKTKTLHGTEALGIKFQIYSIYRSNNIFYFISSNVIIISVHIIQCRKLHETGTKQIYHTKQECIHCHILHFQLQRSPSNTQSNSQSISPSPSPNGR